MSFSLRCIPQRKVNKDGSKYFGPYTDVRSMKASLRMINQIFKIRSCDYNITEKAIEQKKFKVPTSANYHIKNVMDPVKV